MYSTKEIVSAADWDSIASSFAEYNYTFLLKYSSSCAKSHTIKYEINDWLERNINKYNMQFALIDVKKRPELSQEVSELFAIAHASPQLIVIDNNGQVFKFANQYEAVDLIQSL